MTLRIPVPRAYHLYLRLFLIFFFIQTCVRLILLSENPPGLLDSADVFLDGFLWDFFAWVFLSLPIFAISAFTPERIIRRFDSHLFLRIATWILTCVWIFVAFCEFNFWKEFHSRFNFIAVDYLIYTNEVLANIRESFRMDLILSGVAIFSAILTYFVFKLNLETQGPGLLNKKAGMTLFGVVTPVVFATLLGPALETHEPDFHDDQLSRNGWVEFVRAFRSNKIDYKSFYVTTTDEAAQALVSAKKTPLTQIQNPFATKPNIVLIVVESLGAKFIGPLGGQDTTTPFLNNLADKSLFFENLYATGTRTVRGLEAINLSLPPTPGYAVVKRPDHKNLYSLGNTFKANGYNPLFIYGGRGFFDNMNSFFKGNGFSIIDQSDFEKNEVTFTNAWGVCDEDLFAKAEKVMDEKKSSEPTLLFLLTTSNHRPFTYPSGKIDIPSGESRIGGVKYTDYAIGKFIQSSQKKSWAKNTLFIVMADHSTEGRGQFDLEMTDFHIPMWFYAPHHLKPGRIKKLVSQIDLLPSLIHLLGLKDNSPFFGQSVFNENWKEERAFIGNYQYVGYYKDNVLTTLGPNRAVRSFSYDPVTKVQADRKNSSLKEEAVSYYQHASNLLTLGQYHLSK